MTERKESLPCLICGRVLMRDLDEYELQPRNGIMCDSSGNYGSRVLDLMNGERIHFNICDECIVHAGNIGRVGIMRHAVPVRTETPISDDGQFINSQIGWKYVERPVVPWHRGLEAYDEEEYLEPEFLAEHLDELMEDETYKWNLGRRGNQYLIDEWRRWNG